MVLKHEPASSPPPYNSATQDGAESPPPKQYPLPADIKPTNFIRVSTTDSIRGVYVIDPTLTPPASLMSPSPGLQDRKNVLIESQGGYVNLDIFVLPSPRLGENKISMEFNSWSGWARVQVHDAEPQNVSCTRMPLNIVVKAAFKRADVYIPRSFKGPLQLVTCKMGKVWYSKAVKAQVTPISSVEGTHKCFIGDYRLSDWKDGGKSWPGDELQVDARDAINIYYDDEGGIPTKDTSEGGCIVI